MIRQISFNLNMSLTKVLKSTDCFLLTSFTWWRAQRRGGRGEIFLGGRMPPQELYPELVEFFVVSSFLEAMQNQYLSAFCYHIGLMFNEFMLFSDFVRKQENPRWWIQWGTNDVMANKKHLISQIQPRVINLMQRGFPSLSQVPRWGYVRGLSYCTELSNWLVKQTRGFLSAIQT